MKLHQFRSYFGARIAHEAKSSNQSVFEGTVIEICGNAVFVSTEKGERRVKMFDRRFPRHGLDFNGSPDMVKGKGKLFLGDKVLFSPQRQNGKTTFYWVRTDDVGRFFELDESGLTTRIIGPDGNVLWIGFRKTLKTRGWKLYRNCYMQQRLAAINKWTHLDIYKVPGVQLVNKDYRPKPKAEKSEIRISLGDLIDTAVF